MAGHTGIKRPPGKAKVRRENLKKKVFIIQISVPEEVPARSMPADSCDRIS
jgi:hypothetical protein